MIITSVIRRIMASIVKANSTCRDRDRSRRKKQDDLKCLARKQGNAPRGDVKNDSSSTLHTFAWQAKGLTP